MMKRVLALLLVLGGLIFIPRCFAITSGDFQARGGEIYDNWGICRTRCAGDEGFFQVSKSTFRPAIAFESLGDLKDVAWELGENFAEQHSNEERLAEHIFRYVRDHVVYTSDVTQFGRAEFARNADEVAEEMESEGISHGDCEDYAVLLAIMFKAAGFRSAAVLAPEHAAAIVHLPDYAGANAFWDFEGEEDWIWAEATDRKNPLGWTPPDLMRSDLLAYEIKEEPIFGSRAKSEMIATSDEGGQMFFGGSSFFGMLFILWILSLFRRR